MNGRELAIAEAHAADRYFDARPHLKNDVSERVYTAAFYAGFEAATENHARELRAYTATVANLEQRIRELEAQSAAAWKRVLSDKHGIEVYASNDNPGCFGFTGCESDDFESEYEAIQAAVDEQAEAFKGELQAYSELLKSGYVRVGK